MVPPVQLSFYFLFGWIPFLKRTLPQVTFDWSAVALAVICGTLVVLGLHWFCSWLNRQIALGKSESQKTEWPWRWSAGISIGLLLLFSTCVAIIGIVHQVGWWIGSNEPLYVRGRGIEKIQNIHAMKQQSMEIMMAAEDNDWNFTKTESDLARNYFKQPYISIESWNRLLIPGENGELRAALIFHRDADKRAKAGFYLVNRETPELLPIEKLPEELARYGLRRESLSSKTR